MTRKRALVLLAVAVVAAVTAGGLKQLGVGRNLELETVDARFRVRGAVAPPADVVLVQVDERTLGELKLRWPFPRSRHAQLIDRLAAGGPRAIAIDLQFTEPTNIDDDNALIEAIERAGHVVLATTTVDDQGASNVLGGDDIVSDIGARVGSALLPLDPDGAIRRAAYEVEGLETFAVVTAEVSLNRQIDAFDEDRTWIRYAGPPRTLRSYSYSQVLRGRVPPETFRDKIVVVGTEALRLKDSSTTSTTNGSRDVGSGGPGQRHRHRSGRAAALVAGWSDRGGVDPADGRGRAAGGDVRLGPLAATIATAPRRRSPSFPLPSCCSAPA